MLCYHIASCCGSAGQRLSASSVNTPAIAVSHGMQARVAGTSAHKTLHVRMQTRVHAYVLRTCMTYVYLRTPTHTHLHDNHIQTPRQTEQKHTHTHTHAHSNTPTHQHTYTSTPDLCTPTYINIYKHRRRYNLPARL